MKLIAGRMILSCCINSVGNSVPGAGGVSNVGKRILNLCFTKWTARSISSDGHGTDARLMFREKSDGSADGLSRSEDSDGEGISRATDMPAYVKLKDDTLISKALISVKSKKSQKSGSEIFLEGSRLIADAIKFGVTPKVVFFSRKEDVAKIRWPQKNFQLYKVAYQTMQQWSSLSTSPGIIGIFKKPEIRVRGEDKRIMPLLIVCDNIRDPGNLGSILRVAAGVGCKRVLLTKGCVELWEPKVLRSGAGAHFVLPVHSDCTWDSILTEFLDEYSSVVLADNSSVTVDNGAEPDTSRYNIPLEKYLKVDYSGAWDDGSDVVLVLGGETAGLSPEACELAYSRGGARLNIPLYNEIESLNAGTALGIIAFEIRRQFDEWLRRNESLLSKSSSELL